MTLRSTDGQPDRVRDLQGGSGYLSTSEPIVHFGLGSMTNNAGELRIVWPRTGSEQVLTNVTAR